MSRFRHLLCSLYLGRRIKSEFVNHFLFIPVRVFYFISYFFRSFNFVEKLELKSINAITDRNESDLNHLSEACVKGIKKLTILCIFSGVRSVCAG